MSDALPLLGAAFVTGLLGSAHCFGMCAGLSGLFAVNATAVSLRTRLPMALAYNSGRIMSYAFLGAAVAVLGQAIVGAVPHIALPVRLMSGLLIVIIGLQVAFGWRFLSPLETVGARLWNRVAPAAKGLLPVTSMPRALGLGLLWGWLPCGLVYSVLLLAASAAEFVTGGLVMIAFGAGTMPAMVMTGMSASRLSRFMGRRRRGAGLLIVLLGLLTLAMPLLRMTAGPSDAPHAHDSMH